MKKFVFLIALALISTLSAHADLKIVFIDLNKAFDSYYKTKDVQSRLQQEISLFSKDMQDHIADYQKMQDQLKELQHQSEDPTMSAAARAEKKDALSKKYQDYLVLERQMQELRSNKDKELQDENVQNHKRIVDEISNVVKEYATTKGFDLVLDRSAPSMNAAPFLLYNSANMVDITADVITKLNASAPKTSAGMAPSTGLAPTALAPGH